MKLLLVCVGIIHCLLPQVDSCSCFLSSLCISVLSFLHFEAITELGTKTSSCLWKGVTISSTELSKRKMRNVSL